MRIAQLWTIIGAVVFVLGGLSFAFGRFGVGVMLMVGCVVCLGASLAAQRRARKRTRS
ncbi:hypothetical protein ACL9RL_14495 [Plantibacter sp. Mn2098]|uniref:hypothetical protein n=1 Tax=Plantibacter sp. Mn2098 TaxID=3395266 RepID=UPI003BE201B1